MLSIFSTLLLGCSILLPFTPGVSAASAMTALRYTGVGGSGQYSQVTKMVPGKGTTCNVSNACQKSTKKVSGALAPFDEEITMVFRGPLNLHHVAVYQPASAGAATWKKTSGWNLGSKPSNLVFMNNHGGSGSGEWDSCGGASQSYANGAWNGAAKSANAQQYTGKLTGTNEVNIVTGTACSSAHQCQGFHRGTAHHGWSGSKMFVVNFEMPNDGTSNPPAIWILNSQVTNSAQYGCDCRGEGASGGCGELDVLETLPANVNHGISEIYSFKGATGSGNNNWFPRPTGGLVTYAVIMDVKTNAILIEKLSSFDFGQGSVSRSWISKQLGSKALQVPFKAS